MFQFWKFLMEIEFHIYNVKAFESKHFYFNSKNCCGNVLFNYLNLKFYIQFWKLLFQFFKELVEFEIWYLNLKLAISIP
jgi:hypothetical protein